MQSTNRFFHMYSSSLYPTRISSFGVPSVYRQAEDLGGKFTRIAYGLPELTVANFSPCVTKHNDKTYIVWRNQEHPFGFRWDQKYFYLNNTPTDVYIGQLADDQTVLGARKLRSGPHRLSYEDPRIFVGPDDQLYTQFVTSTYASKYERPKTVFRSEPKVVVCLIDDKGEAVSAVYPPIGNNRKAESTEKNWCFFTHNEELHCLYSTRDIVIEHESGPAITIDSSVLDSVTNQAPTFNSTAPIDIGDSYLVFYHWKHMAVTPGRFGYLLYHLGCYLLDKNLTKITHICDRPILTGSLDDNLIQWTNYAGQPVSTQPAVVLPFGGFVENNELVLSVGINDAFMGILRIDLDKITQMCRKVA